MMRNFLFTACLALLSSCDGGIPNADAFGPPPAFSSPRLLTSAGHHHRSHSKMRRTSRAAAASSEISPDDYDLLPPEEEDAAAAAAAIVANRVAEATDLKRRLLAVAASYDRGFGATPAARAVADDIIQRLAALNPTREGASRGIDGDSYGDDDVPLRAIWRMIWTSAFDVVSLGASPFAAPSAIYQDIRNPPVAINIIDFIPRAQSLLPPSMSPPSLLRAKVSTRASSRSGMSNRVGLSFEGLELQPIELLGRRVDGLPPLSVDFTWPGSLLKELAALVPGLGDALGAGKTANDDASGYFDVEYLDDELLIIRQQAPGGVFALVKVDSCDP